MNLSLKSVFAGIAMSAVAVTTQAMPLVYEGDLASGDIGFGAVTGYDDEFGLEGDWWRIYLDAGDSIDITAQRLDAGMDPAATLYFGGHSEADQVAGGDDNIAEPVGLEGPWSDPFFNFVAVDAGWYSLSVWNFFSTDTSGDTSYNYCVGVDVGCGPGDVANVPEPASLALLGLGLIGVGVARRRRSAKA